jgi:mRNA-degrading endonuclease RelE of RelBE toxin-antitoxin system
MVVMVIKHQVVVDERFIDDLKKRFNKEKQEKILKYIINNIDNTDNPKQKGSQQHFDYKINIDTTNMWSYDINDTSQKLLVYLNNNKVIILALSYKQSDLLYLSKNKLRHLYFLIQSIDYNHLISIRELCSRLDISYDSLLQRT